jgi:hypothetical protein
MLDFNSEPYFNDFDEDNKFYSILFRPSVAVQARELNQLQTILQKQIKAHGDHVFKNGTVVIPGEFSINDSINYVKLTNIGTTPNIFDLIGLTIQNTSGLEALVVHAVAASGADPVTLYLSYTKSADDNITKVFANSEVLSSTTGGYTGITVASAAASGFGSIATVQKGVYYINGYFVLCETQSITLDKYSNVPSYRIGFNVIESSITSDDAGYESLLDNAQGSYNYAAPGAHRYFIELILDKLTIDASSEVFSELGRVVNGTVITAMTTTGYAQLEKTLARRTYDESGDYTVKPFQIDVREHRDNDRGDWDSSRAFKAGDIVINASKTYQAINDMAAAAAAPVHTSGIVNYWEQRKFPSYNRGIYSADADATTGTVGDINQLAIGFEPGKAYVQGYELEKLATTYVAVSKPRDAVLDVASINNASIATTVGSYVLVTEVFNLPPMSTGGTVIIYDSIVTTAGTAAGTIIGSCKIRGIQTESGTGAATVCKMFIYDIKMNAGKDFAKDAKSFYYAATAFTTNVVYDTKSIPVGIITTTAASGAVVGVGTTWSTGIVTPKLKVGDWIYFDGVKHRVATLTSDTSIVVSPVVAALRPVAAAVAASKIQTQLKEPESTALVFPLPYQATKTITDHSYYVVQAATMVSAVGNVLNISVTSGTLLPDASNYYVQDAAGNSIGATNFTVTTSSGTAALTFAAAPSTLYKVFATVNKTGVVSRKTKTLSSATHTFTLAQAKTRKLTLGNTDCYKIVNIFMGTTDITDWFSFDDGQRPSYYDHGRLILQPSYPTPTAPITVTYQYFIHTAGDFFDKDSYINIDYSLIPFYSGINLRDTIDFRPRLNAFALNMPKRGYNMSVDLSYYLARQDKIAIDINGKFFDIKGSSSLNPGIPTDSSTGMTLCTLTLPPYIFASKQEVEVTKTENKRYTMRDIGKLETRISNIEYYTSLSMLEQETSSLSITDADGLERFKNGFIVDNFSGHNIGDVASPDYMCAIDMENNELRPFAAIDNVDLLLDTVNSTNYKLYGDVITLPLNTTTPHVALAKNIFASRTEFVNPFAVFTFLGSLTMNPSSDDWFEVKRLPDIITNKEGNFNILTQLAQRTGVLGTVWNSWQTQWTGKPVVTTKYSGIGAGKAKEVGATGQDISVSAGLNREVWGWALNGGTYSVTTTTAQRKGQSRTGINTKAVAKIDTQIVNDRVLSVAVIPYIRSRNVLVQVKALKPNTKFYPFFDDVNVAAFCTPATIINYTTVSGTFDAETNSGIDASTEAVRKINGDTQVCLNIGDIITGTTSGKKAVVVGEESNTSVAGVVTHKLYVLNVSGAFTSGETITGSISGAVGKYVSSSVPTTLTTGAGGELNLLFKIPNTNKNRFRTGTREFKLQDVATFNGQFTSQGLANYEASGTIQTKQANVVATRNVEFVQTQVSGNRTIVESSDRVVSGTAWYDPLAQTFLVDCKGGAFLSKVDLFFASKDGNIPVTIEIREVVNGYPGRRILPFSRVTVKSKNVKLSGTKVDTFDGVRYPKYDTPTTITFPSPVYVKDKTEYALVILSDSNQYKVWISQMGDKIPASNDTISKQPYLGVLFKSQNASTWTASQDQDLKFTIWRANFNTSVTGNVVLTNNLPPKIDLMSDPIQTLAGSSTVRVWHEDHGFKAGDVVTLSGAVSTDATITTAMLNTTFTVSNPQLDSYTIVVGANATSTGFIGDDNVFATRKIIYETIQPSISALDFSDTTANYSIITTEYSSGLPNAEESCIINDNNYYVTPKVIYMNATRMVKIRGALTSTNPALSPIIDSHGCSAIIVSNKIDKPVEETYNVAAIDRSALWAAAASSFAFLDSTITSAVSGNQEIMKQIIPGSYVEVANNTTTSNNGKYLVTDVNSTLGTITVANKTFVNGNSSATALLYYYNSFFDEIAPVGSSSHSKYVSKVITLANQSNMLRVKFAVCAPTESDVLLYYKIGTGGTDLIDTNWTIFNPDKTMPKTSIGSDSFYDVDYTLDELNSFDALSVKIVMKSTNTAAVPRVKDLRIIACAA